MTSSLVSGCDIDVLFSMLRHFRLSHEAIATGTSAKCLLIVKGERSSNTVRGFSTLTTATSPLWSFRLPEAWAISPQPSSRSLGFCLRRSKISTLRLQLAGFGAGSHLLFFDAHSLFFVALVDARNTRLKLASSTWLSRRLASIFTDRREWWLRSGRRGGDGGAQEFEKEFDSGE